MKFEAGQSATGDRVLLTGKNERWGTVVAESTLTIEEAERLAQEIIEVANAIRERRVRLPPGTIAARVKALRAQAVRCGRLGDDKLDEGKKDAAERWHNERRRLEAEADELEGIKR